MNLEKKNPDIRVMAVGPYQSNCYILTCTQTMVAVVIDPGAEDGRIANKVEEVGCTVKMILNTHGHPDHVMANGPLKERWQVPVAMHQGDVDFFLAMQSRSLTPVRLPFPQPEIILEDGQVLKVGNLEITVLHTPGHTPGSVCFLCEGNLFTGDTLFVEGVGRTDTGGMTLKDMLKSIETKILPLPDDTVVLPGHDYGPAPMSTVGKEKENNPYIRDFILDH